MPNRASPDRNSSVSVSVKYHKQLQNLGSDNVAKRILPLGQGQPSAAVPISHGETVRDIAQSKMPEKRLY